MIDNISVALFAIEDGGAVVLANRAARQLAGRPVARLEDVAVIGRDQAVRLLALPPGERILLRLADSQRVLASAARFKAAGASCQLLSLQNIESELDAVELQAWAAIWRPHLGA